MSAWGYDDGKRETARGVLSDTSATTMLNAATQAFDVVGIKLVNTTGSGVSPLVDVYDGTTSFVLRDDDVTLAANTAELIDLPGDFYKLKRGDLLRVTESSGLHWHVSYIIPFKGTGPTDG